MIPYQQHRNLLLRRQQFVAQLLCKLDQPFVVEVPVVDEAVVDEISKVFVFFVKGMCARDVCARAHVCVRVCVCACV